MKLATPPWLISCAIAVILGLSVCWLPAPLPITAPASDFSAERGLEHVRAIAQKPHPAGSEENLRVRGYVVSALSALGLRVRVLEGERSGVRLGNVYAELQGERGGKPVVLLVSHYDSTPGGPGAADAASGVATLLETLRAVRAGPPLLNGLAILVTDGEEDQRGLLGARLFVETHPELWRDVKVVLNLEARGNHGPVLMFQTGRGNLDLIALLSKTCPYPIAQSFSQEVQRRMPNDTDFTEFLRIGSTGLNFSFVGGVEYYHSQRDTPDNLSLRTLQHYGSYLLPLTLRLGNADGPTLQSLQGQGDAIFFPLWRGMLVHYPADFTTALASLAVALFGVAVWFKRRSLRAFKVLRSLGLSVLSFILIISSGVAVVLLLVWAFKARRYGPAVIGLPFEDLFLALLAMGSAAVTLGLTQWLLHGLTREERLGGAIVPWLALTLVAARLAPGVDYLFMWPTLLATIALFLPIREEEKAPGWIALGAALTAAPAPLLLAPTTYLLNQAMTIGLAPISIGLISLAFSLIDPHAAYPLRKPR